MKRPAFQFYPADWRKDTALQLCSIAARGLWHELLCVMHESTPYGHLAVNGAPIAETQAARLCGVELREYRRLMAELDASGVPSRTVNGIVYSRRMVRDERLRVVRAQAGKLGGNPNLVVRLDKQTAKQMPTPSSSSSSSSSASELQNRGVGVTHRSVPEPPVDNPADPAMKKTANGKNDDGCGQNWDDPAWWQATAKTVGRERRVGESDEEWRDGVFAAVRARRMSA